MSCCSNSSTVLKKDCQDQQIHVSVIDFFFFPSPCDNFSLNVRSVP